MSTVVTKRVAQVYLEAADAEKIQKRLAEEAKAWADQLERAPKGSKEAEQALRRLNQIQSQYSKSVRDNGKETESVFASLKNGLGPLAGMMGLTFGGAAVIGGIQRSRQEFLEHERAVDKLNATLKSTGNTVGVTSTELINNADRLETSSLFSQEQILTDSTNRLLTYTNIQGETFNRAQQAAIDMAAALGGDLAGASETVGKALGSPMHAMASLSKQGFRFSDEQKEVIQTLMETGRTAEAQAIILEELEEAYAGQAEASARNEQGTRALDQAMGAFVEGTGGFFNEAINDIAGSLAPMLNGLAEWLGLSDKQSDALNGQRMEMNALFNVLRAGNVTEEQRADLVRRINSEYKDYLPTAISVSDSTEQLADAQRSVNTAMLEQIRILAQKELLEEAQRRAVDAQKEALELEIKLSEVAQGKVSTWDQVKASAMAGGSAVGYYAGQLGNARAEAVEASKEFEELYAKMGGTPEGAAPAPAAPAPEDDQVTERAKQVREKLKEAQQQIEIDRKEGMDREIAIVVQKYHKLALEAEGSGVDLQEIENVQGQEIQKIRAKYAEKEIEQLRKLDEQIQKVITDQHMDRMDAARRQAMAEMLARHEAEREGFMGSAEVMRELVADQQAELAELRASQVGDQQAANDEQEIMAVRDKYAKLLEEARGHKDRIVQIQGLMAFEIEQKEIEQAQRRIDRQREQEQREVDLRTEHNAARLASMDARHQAEIAEAERLDLDMRGILARQEEERIILADEAKNAEFERINARFEELYAIYDQQGLDTSELQRMHGEAMAMQQQEFDRTQVARNEEKNQTIIASEERRRDAVKAIGESTIEFITASMQVMGENAAAAADMQKVATVFQLGIDTAKAYSSLMAASEGNPLNLLTGGAAGIAQFALGVIRIGTNVAKAMAAMNKPKPQAAAKTYAAGGHTELASWFDPTLGTTVSLSGPTGIDRSRPSIAAGGTIGSPTLAWVGEAGTEWVGPNWMLNRPDLEPVFQYLEHRRQLGPNHVRFAAGGPTTTTTAPASAPPAMATPTPDPMLLAVLAQMQDTNARLSAQIARGIGVNNDLLVENQTEIADIQSAARLTS